MKKITIVNGDDWQGLYVDGRLIREDHRLQVDEVLISLGYDLKNLEADGKWLDITGSLPSDLKDVKIIE